VSASVCITDYAEAGVLFVLSESQSSPADYGYVKRSSLIDTLSFAIQQPVDIIDFDKVVDRLVEKGIVEVISDSFAGDFYSFNTQKLLNFVHKEKSVENSILFKMNKIGLPFLNAAIEQSNSENIGLGIEYKSINIPASDRIVTLKHNQIYSIDESASDIITCIERENAIPDHPSLRELIIGQLRAGRELIRTGVFKAELLHMTLVIGLKMLLEKYEGHAIGAMASKLLDLILTEIGIG
jgi:hypothetical protein